MSKNINLHRILIVEDNEDDLELTMDALAENMLIHDFDIVRDGADAIDYIFKKGKWKDRETENPALILLDLKLPKVSGLEVLKAIRENEPTRLIPVVILTSSSEEQDIISGYKLGTNAYVVKPVIFEDFMEAVRKLGAFWGIINVQPGKSNS